MYIAGLSAEAFGEEGDEPVAGATGRYASWDPTANPWTSTSCSEPVRVCFRPPGT